MSRERTSQLEAAVLRHVSKGAHSWFPEVGAAPPLRLHRLAERPRALLYAVYIGDESTPRLIAKVRRDWSPSTTAAAAPGARPRLSPSLLTAAEMTALEYQGLTAIERMVDGAASDFAAVRPLDHLVDENAILMEYVPASTLRDLALRRSRLSPNRRATGRVPRDVWRRSGAWLRRFQDHMPRKGLPGRQGAREDVVAMFDAFGDFLERGLGRRVAGETARRGAELAADVLPAEIPLAVGHGDYAPRNVFVLPDGRIAVFDPLPRWLVPRHEDLCRFLVSLRMQGLTLLTRGWSDGARRHDRRERLVIEGYRAEERLPMPQLRCYQLLITLDRWSALLAAPTPGRGHLSSRLRNASVVMSSDYFRGEARRLLDLAETEAG